MCLETGIIEDVKLYNDRILEYCSNNPQNNPKTASLDLDFPGETIRRYLENKLTKALKPRIIPTLRMKDQENMLSVTGGISKYSPTE